MAVLQTQRIVVSLSAKRRQIPKGSKILHFTEEVIYKTYLGKEKCSLILKSFSVLYISDLFMIYCFGEFSL